MYTAARWNNHNRHMDREEVFDLYFEKLYSLITRKRAAVEKVIPGKIRRELISRWKEDDEAVIKAYADAAVSFIDERIYSYSLDRIDRFLQSASRGVSPQDAASLEISLDWYDCRQEKEEIDARIESGLNLFQPADEIAGGLIEDFGAFPDKTIMNTYKKFPVKNHLPDYALALSLERVIRGSGG